MAIPPPPPPKPVPAVTAPPLDVAKAIEKHVDAWIRGQGPAWQGGPVSIGEHKRHDPTVLAELVALFKAAGWLGATITDEHDAGAVLHLIRAAAEPAPSATPAPDPADVHVTA